MVEEPADELQREILERERRPVEELQQPLVRVELHERADRRVAEPGVGLVAQALEQRGLQLVAREGPDDARRDARVGLAGAEIGGSAGHCSGTYRPPSLASPASRVSLKPSAGARPRVET